VKPARPAARLGAPRAFVVACALLTALAWASPARAREPIVTRFDVPDNRIAITFDACATRTHGYGFDRHVYRILQREHVPATIFVSGRWVEFHAGVMGELAADPLIEFGNHSYDHPHMSRLGNDEMAREVDETEAVLGRYGKHGVAFRPPFGDFNARMLDVVRERGLPVVTWDVVSGDPAAATTTQGMIREVERHTRPGSIVIFHINGRGWKTAEALPSILRQLRSRGFTFVHVSELLGARPAPPVLVSAAPVPQAAPPPAASAEPPEVSEPEGSETPAAESLGPNEPFGLRMEIAPQFVSEPATVQPPPFRASTMSARGASGPTRAPDEGGRPMMIERAGHAPTAANMRWAAENAKRVLPAPRDPAESARAVPR